MPTVAELHAKLTSAIEDTSAQGHHVHDELFAPDAIFVSYPPGFSLPTTSITQLKMDILHQAIVDTTVFAECAMSGIYDGPEGSDWLGARKGSRFNVRVCTVTTFNTNNVVSRRSIYWDEDTLRKQLTGKKAAPTTTPKIRFNLTVEETELLAEFSFVGAGEYTYAA